ncbi:MAG: hypothetical protein JOZ40_07155 [Methylobacteriaceae bacterium]|nr:hypothetical protein [Methylobacteriaceae bacterium]
MKYQDGIEMRVGDRVRIRNGDTGTIVASMDAGEFSPDYPKENWEHFKTGILTLTDKGALVRFDEPFPQKLAFRIGE